MIETVPAGAEAVGVIVDGEVACDLTRCCCSRECRRPGKQRSKYIAVEACNPRDP
jgi:hypothetical protein